MSVEGKPFYPGEKASPKQLLLLATAYREAAEALLRVADRKAQLSRWPYRFMAIHSVELFLNAYLLCNGISPETVRGMQHDFAERAKLAIHAGLKLKKRTAEHLSRLRQEYLIARYEPTPQDKLSELTRLGATLDDVAKKVETAVSCDKK